MLDCNDDKINTGKIHAQVSHLKRLRAAPNATLPVGWDDDKGHVPPPAANALEKAGLAFITVRLSDGYRTVTAR